MSRIPAVSAVLGELTADRLIAFSNGIPDFLAPDPVVLLSGFRPIGPTAVAQNADGTGVLAISPRWAGAHAHNRADGRLAVLACDELAAELEALVGSSARVAVVGLDEIDEPTRAALERSGVELVNAERELLSRTGPKSHHEIDNARRATRLAATAYAELLGTIEVGMAEYEFIAELDARLARLGAEDNFVLMSSGPVGQPLRQPTGRRLERGDVVGIEVSPCVGNQFTQICRTIVIGEASASQRDDYALLGAAFAAGLGRARAGVSAGAVAEAVDGPIVAAGYGDYCRPPYMRVRGHGLGLSTVAPGGLHRDNTTTLESGMLFVLHPNQHLPRSGYLLCGGPILINEDSAEALLDWEPKLDEVEV